MNSSYIDSVRDRRIRLGIDQPQGTLRSRCRITEDMRAHVDMYERCRNAVFYAVDPAGEHVKAWIRHINVVFPLDLDVLELNDGRRQWLATSCGVSISRIIAETSNYTMISVEDILSQRREREIVVARQVAYHLARKLTTKSIPEIGRAFAHRDHTTILHGLKKIGRLIDSDEDLRKAAYSIERELRGEI